MNRREFLQKMLAGGIIVTGGNALNNNFFIKRPSNYGNVDVHAPGTQVPKSVNPLFKRWMRDVQVEKAPDGYYYLTGTIADKGYNYIHAARQFNKGIMLWRSKDLKNWENMGYVWTFDKDGTWQKDFGIAGKEKNRTLWAASIHYISSQKNYFIVACVPHNPHGSGSFILRSKTGKPEGPYENIEGNKKGPLFKKIDGNLFEDDDGKVYFLGHAHYIARMKDDMSGFSEPLRKFNEKSYQPEPYIEGISVFKANGKYHLVQAIWSVRLPDGTYTYAPGNTYHSGRKIQQNKYSYDCVIATADNIYGPYSYRYTAITDGGHNNFIKDDDGNWWATMFGNPGSLNHDARIVCNAALVPMHVVDGKFKTDNKRTL
ncbi:MAG TPA: family 43 glycosylhydrolase [Balneolales bacterium]|nr:family 43 glycosylhydrolase [Balneolales bacterium]